MKKTRKIASAMIMSAPLARDEVAEGVEVAVGDVSGQRGHEQHEGDCDGLHGWDVGESE